MLHLTQSLKSGEIRVEAAPAGSPPPAGLLVRSGCSVLSAGTERMLLDFGRAGWLEKARQQPEKVRMVLDKIRTDGLAATIESVRAKLDQPLAMGYCNAGTVLDVGSGVVEFAPGDRVASNGAHAEVVSVAKNLAARIPASVPDEAAAFTVVGAIALEGVRLALPTLGECFAVTGLGLIGLMTVQLLRAHGCRVLGIDFDRQKLDLAERWGAESVDLSEGADPLRAAAVISGGRGLDGVIVAAATKSSDPIHQAACMCRKRGRIVLVGVTGLELSREDFYKKELTFQVSCSYGPGRYDPAYEEKGQDYPLGFVRWTAQRNFEAVLQLMAEGKLQTEPLITHRFPFEEVDKAYELLLSGEPHLGIVLTYPPKPEEDLQQRTIRTWGPPRGEIGAGRPVIGLIGTGQHAVRALLPVLKESSAYLKAAADHNGASAAAAARKFGFAAATTDSTGVLGDPEIDTVFIATRHDSHAVLVCEALKAGKNVYIEKPLAIQPEQLDEIESLCASLPTLPVVMLGFNRRFAPHSVKAHQLLKRASEPKAMIMTVNAGAVPAEHWTQDRECGGGRVVGEACHFIDLLRFLAGSPIVSTSATRLNSDTVTITLGFADGSTGSVHYFANGQKSYPKERLEIFCGGRILQLNNFRRMIGYGWSGFRKMNLWRQDKGHAAAIAAFLRAVREGRASPVPLDEAIEVTRATFEVA